MSDGLTVEREEKQEESFVTEHYSNMFETESAKTALSTGGHQKFLTTAQTRETTLIER